MTIVHSLEEVAYDKNSIVTVGTFDGVHLGHRAIIEQVVRRAGEERSRSVVITFDPHPREVLGIRDIRLLTTLEERLNLISRLRVDLCFVIQFTYSFSRLTSEEFYRRFLVEGSGVREVIEGHDHMFGRDREADMNSLQDLGRKFDFRVVSAVTVQQAGAAVGSSRIRELLLRGDVEQAEQLLGRAYSITGTVVRGDGRGAQLGFPTANVQPTSSQKLVPANGVYFVGVHAGAKQFFGMLNIGTRPTLTEGLDRVIEVHLFESNDDLYNARMTIHFHKRLRNEQQFSSKEELIAQLERDRSACLKFVDALSLSSNIQ